MKKWQRNLYKFMYGRYGFDELYKLSITIYFIIFILNLFIKNIIVTYIELLIIIIIFYRVFSKQINKRQKENNKYLKIRNKIIKYFKLKKTIWKDRNTKYYKKCPKCKTILRLPLKKGKHTVNCPTCHHRFTVKVKRNEKIKVEIIK